MKEFIGKAVPKFVGLYLNTLSLVAPEAATEKALSLFATPRKGKVLDDQKDFLATGNQKQLYFNETPIMTYHWPGKGKTILLAHGWESNSFRWYRLIETLRQDDFNIIALDAPAHGQSGSSHFNALLYADFINEVVKHYRPNVIIGHSVGGMASAIFRNKYQDDVLEKLVLIGAPSEFVNVFENYTSLLGYNSQLKNSLNELITERFGNTPESFSTAQYLKDVETEGLIIHDKLDKIIAYEEALRIKKTFRNASLISTEGLGHSLHHESVNRHILEFLNS